MELSAGSIALCGLPRKDHAASGVRIRFVRRHLAVGKRGDRIAAFLNAALEANGDVALETDGLAALQATPGDIAGAARSPKQEESPGREKRSMRNWLGHPSAFGRLSTSGLRPFIRAWRPACKSRPRTSPQSRCAYASRLGSDAHLRLAAAL